MLWGLNPRMWGPEGPRKAGDNCMNHALGHRYSTGSWHCSGGCEETGTARGITPGFSSRQEMVVTSFLTVSGKAEGENSRAEELHRKK